MKIKEMQPINYDAINHMKDDTLQDFYLESLAPKRTDSVISYYSKIINAGIQDKNVQNIALTGSYGAGKSSVLKTFKEDYPKKYKYLNISLANFRCEEESKQVQSKIRLSILQQMFYHAHIRKIPDSRFKRIKAFSLWHTVLFLTALASFFVSFFMLFKPKILSEIPLVRILPSELPLSHLSACLYWVIFLISLFYFFKILYHAKFGIHSIKLSAKGNVELNGAKKEPHLILNEHLDEILYLFERKKFNVVIIEDLDRFNDITIFEELRELNFLINNAKQLEGQKVTFIYALNDCLFELIDKIKLTEEESKKDNKIEPNNVKEISKLEFSTTIKNKTKFFDLIIPIIPFINVTNSYNFFKKT